MSQSKTVLLFLLFGLASLQAQSLEDYQSLFDDSPFLTMAFKERIAREASIRNYTFNGYARFGKEWQLCLINQATGLAEWHTVGADVGGYKLTKFNPKKQAITFEKEGITSTLKLEQIQ